MISMAYLISGLLAFASAVFAYKYRRLPGSYFFLLLSLLTVNASIASNMEYRSSSLESMLLWRNVQQISYFYSPVMILYLSLALSGLDRRIKASWVLGTSVLPTIGLGLIFTDSYHHLMRKSVTPGEEGILLIERTGLNGLVLSYLTLLFLITMVVLFRTLIFTNGLQRRQIIVLILGITFPTIISTLRFFHIFPISGHSASITITYIPSLLLLLWGMFKYQLFEVVPIARNKLFDVMKEGIVVLDADRRIVDSNQAARVMLERISGESHDSLNGKQLDQAVKGLDSWIAAHSSLEEREIELRFGTEAEPFYIAVKIIPVIYGTQTYAGSMSVMTDMTEIRRNELELRWRAVTDGLTGIYNRYGFIEKTEHAIRASLEENLPLCLLVVDIDHFKRINDRYGHLAGDKAIQAFVGAVERIREESWIFGRIGGEEFAITLSNVGEVEALAIAEYIRDEVQQTVVQSSKDNIRFTVSIGVACQTEETNTFERLYSLADQSLYKVKQGGRNGVHMENLG